MSKIDEIKQRRELITNKGNWFVANGEDILGNCGYDEPDSIGWIKGGVNGSGQNADFVAHSPADIDYLLHRLKKAREALNKVSEQLKDIDHSARWDDSDITVEIIKETVMGVNNALQRLRA